MKLWKQFLLLTCLSLEIIESILEASHNEIKDILAELISHQIIEQRLADWGYTYDYHSKKLKMKSTRKLNLPEKKHFTKSAPKFGGNV